MLGACLAVSSVTGIAHAATGAPGRSADATGRARAVRIARQFFVVHSTVQQHGSLTRPRSAPHPSVSAAATTSAMSERDPVGDINRPGGDVAEVGARYTANSLRLTAKIPGAADPQTSLLWRYGETSLLWAIDAGGDGTIEKVAILFAFPSGRLVSAVLSNRATPNGLCAGNATFDQKTFAVMVPTACIGSPAQVSAAVQMTYDTSISVPGVQGTTDEAPDTVLMGPLLRANTAAGTAGGFVVDSSGDVHAVNIGGAPKALNVAEPIVNPRGIVVTPDGGHGWVLDGHGHMTPFGLGRNDSAPAIRGLQQWPTKDFARAVAIRSTGGSGYVVDAYGGLHYFGIGGNRIVPRTYNAPRWPGIDMVRGIALLPNGTGGYVLDQFGGLHWFSITTKRDAPALFGAPSFGSSDSARGVTILADGTGGFVVDATGALHWFAIGVDRAAPPVTGAPSWPGQDRARGVAVVTKLSALPPPPP